MGKIGAVRVLQGEECCSQAQGGGHSHRYQTEIQISIADSTTEIQES